VVVADGWWWWSEPEIEPEPEMAPDAEVEVVVEPEPEAVEAVVEAPRMSHTRMVPSHDPLSSSQGIS
jgi:hypothetical protein